MSAMLALGLVGAGTNNSRVAGMLRALASFYAREANHLFILRLSQVLPGRPAFRSLPSVACAVCMWPVV
jgi:hypothetical protein